MNQSERETTQTRMAEYLSNWQAQRKPKRKPGLVSYDWAKRRVVNAERRAHKKCFGICGDAARENFDRIFGKRKSLP